MTAALLARLHSWWLHPPSYRVVRWLFPRLLALVYAIAFGSWLVQCDGLVGAQGIVPAGDYLQRVHEVATQRGEMLFWQMPGLFYWHYSDGFMHVVCWLGVVLALVVIAGYWQGPCLLLLWFGYLSVMHIGSVFMSFQWDALLCECGFCTLFLASWRMRAKLTDAPTGAVFLLHWLLFRLMLLSGYVKIGGADPVWLDDTALAYHFETQPLPTWVGWWAHQLPGWVQRFNCKAMFVIELWIPFAIVLGRWGRLLACTAFVALMAGVALTGNYTFFNLLTAFLSLTLLDDRWWPGKLRGWLRCTERPRLRFRLRHVHAYAAVVLITMLSLVSADLFLQGRVKGWTSHSPEWARESYSQVAPWSSINAYGLFQDMTTERLEVDVQVSKTGALWESVAFRWKPTELAHAPGFVAPYQPRLDWQMWFAVFNGSFDPQRDMASPQMQWFGLMLSGLLEHRPEVWSLVGSPPLPMEDIKHVRAVLYRYRFTTPEERRKTGNWWKREYLGPFSPAFSRRDA